MSSSARAYQYQYSEALETEENFVPVQKPVRENMVLREIRLKQARKKVKNRILVKVSLLIALGLFVALRYASITEINYRNQQLQNEYDTLLAQVAQQQVEIESQMSVAEIAEIAQNKLGMQKPQPYQIVEIQTESIDQTEMNAPEYTKETASKPWYAAAWDKVLLFFGLIGA